MLQPSTCVRIIQCKFDSSGEHPVCSLQLQLFSLADESCLVKSCDTCWSASLVCSVEKPSSPKCAQTLAFHEHCSVFSFHQPDIINSWYLKNQWMWWFDSSLQFLRNCRSVLMCFHRLACLLCPIGSRHRASNSGAEARRLLVNEASHPPDGAAATQSSLGLPLWGDAVAFCRLCSREALEERGGSKGRTC